jgi:hypothetical protein
MNRVSSTSIGTFITCPRKFWYRYRELLPAHPQEVNEAMATGTVFHAFMEFRASRGRWPTDGEFAEMKGSYDDPIEAVRRFPRSKAAGFTMAQRVLAQRPDLVEFDEDTELEHPLDAFGLTLGDVAASGFIDVFFPSRRLIRDYKTRGSFRYMPRTPEDFRADVQQSYYAAAVAGANGWDSIQVEHVNVMRPDKGEGIEVVTVEIPVSYLKGVWTHLDETVVPEMRRLAEEVADEKDVPVNRGACWTYGKCPFFGICGATREEDADDPFRFFKEATTQEDPFGGIF